MMKNILAIDVGNTNTVFGIYKQDHLFHTYRVVSNLSNFNKALKDLIKKFEINFVSIASVVPKITESFKININSTPYICINGKLDLGIKYPMEDPSFVGADLIANIYSALKKYQTNCIIIDFGTATTVQFVSEDWVYYGCAILPGINTAACSLFKKAALINTINLDNPKHILGKNTQESLNSGIILSHVYAVEGYIINIKKQYKHIKNIKTIATGGLVDLITKNTNIFDIIDKNLTLDGVFFIAM